MRIRLALTSGSLHDVKCTRASALERLEGGRDILGSPDFQLARLRGRACGPLPEPRPSPARRRDCRHWPGSPTGGDREQPRARVRAACQQDRSPGATDPVTLPPGRARLATRPLPTGSIATAKTIGMTDVACFAAADGGSVRDNDIDLEPDELGRDLGIALDASLRPAILDRDGATFDPAEFAQSLHKSGVHGLEDRSVPRPRSRWSAACPAAARAPRAATPPPRRREA